MIRQANEIGPIGALLICLLAVKAAVADEAPVCLATENQPICTCDLTKLRPLQGAVGMKQVIYMENRIAEHPRHARGKLEDATRSRSWLGLAINS